MTKHSTESRKRKTRIFPTEEDIFMRPQKLNNVSNSSYERSVIHPAVAEWLTANGYSWRHEPRTPVGNPDFLAVHPSGKKLVVECKDDGAAYKLGIRQLLDYQRHLGASYECMLVLPKATSTDKISQSCALRRVMLLALDVPDKPEDIEVKVIAHAHNLLFEKAMFMEDISRFPQKAVQEIIDFHQARDSSPVDDLETARKLIRHAIIIENERSHGKQRSMKTIDDSFDEIISSFEVEPTYLCLKDLVKWWLDIALVRRDEYKKLSDSHLKEFGVIPPQTIVDFCWQAEKQAEFCSMAWMVDVFDFDESKGDEACFTNELGEIVSTSLIWEGSAHSFNSASEWQAWHDAHKPVSYFDQFEFWTNRKAIDLAASIIKRDSLVNEAIKAYKSTHHT